MSNWLLALFLKPFAALVLFCSAAVVARLAYRHIPPGKVKTLLYDPTLRDRHPWKFALLFMGLAWGLLGAVALVVYH